MLHLRTQCKNKLPFRQENDILINTVCTNKQALWHIAEAMWPVLLLLPALPTSMRKFLEVDVLESQYFLTRFPFRIANGSNLNTVTIVTPL